MVLFVVQGILPEQVSYWKPRAGIEDQGLGMRLPAFGRQAEGGFIDPARKYVEPDSLTPALSQR